jgi:hypothetical protein
VHAARQVSFAAAGVRIRQVASAGQSWSGGAPTGTVTSRRARAAGRWPGRWAGPG